MNHSQPRKAYVLRVAPGKIDRVQEALENDEVIIGWGKAPGLTDDSLSLADFRTAIHVAHYSDNTNLRRAGKAAGHMWRFIRDMAEGDVVVVPHSQVFYVACIKGPAFYDPRGTAYRRPVTWLNKTAPLRRSTAPGALQHRLGLQGTSHDATDLLAEILLLPLAWGAPTTPRAVDLASDGGPARVLSETYRILRDTAIARELKAIHADRCQLCGIVITIYRGQTYSEAHHIQPLGSDHRGSDIRENILVLCPNCHAKCDYGAIRLDMKAIHTIPQHKIGSKYLAYHNANIWQGSTVRPIKQKPSAGLATITATSP